MTGQTGNVGGPAAGIYIPSASAFLHNINCCRMGALAAALSSAAKGYSHSGEEFPALPVAEATREGGRRDWGLVFSRKLSFCLEQLRPDAQSLAHPPSQHRVRSRPAKLGSD
jgi:hypothetical protein